MRDRRLEISRFQSPSPPRRLESSPVKFRDVGYRDRGYSTLGHIDNVDMKEDKRRGSYSRRDYDRHHELGGREYDRNYDRREGDYERGSRDYERNFDRGDRGYSGSFNYGGGGMSNSSCDRERYMDGEAAAAGAECSQPMYRSSIHQSSNDPGHSGRVFKYGEGGESASAKFQRNHFLYEPEKSDGFKNSINCRTGSSGRRTELEYGHLRSKYSDEGVVGFAQDGKTARMGAERGRDYLSSSYQMDLEDLPKSSNQADVVRGLISVPSHFSRSSFHKHEDFHLRDKPNLDKLVADGPSVKDQLAREANSLRYSRVDIDFMASSSRSKAFDAVPHGSLKQDIPGSLVLSDGVEFSTGMNTNYSSYDDYGAKSRTRSPLDPGGRFDNFKSYSGSYVDASEERSSNWSYPEVGRSEIGAMATRPIETYGKMEGLGERYGHQDMLRTGLPDSNTDGRYNQGYLRGHELPPATSLGQSAPHYYDVQELLYAKKKDMHDQDLGNSRPSSYGTMLYHGHGGSVLGELHQDYKVGGSSWSPKKRGDGVSPRNYDASLGNIDGRPQQEFPRPPKKISKRRYDTEKHANNDGRMVYDTGHAGEPWRDDMDSNILSKKLKLTNSRNGKTRETSNFMARQQLSTPVSVRSYSGKPHSSHIGDIKNRLGPCPKKAHVSERLSQNSKPSIKKRLGPDHQKNQKSHFTCPPWVKNVKAPRLPRTEGASNGSHLDQGEEPLGGTLATAKPEPPENSEEFKQMVLSAFFKFVKQLNQIPANRKKYREQGKAGSLKCIVCGSSSKDFGDTEGLARHAFTCQKGLRSQHLGFHKALCALMGWKSAESVNGGWICEMLSHNEDLCIKEDLILWPPVVVVHNSTITNQNQDQRVIITLEELDARLRDMGFGDKMKVHRGKPANQSVMVVQFGATLSGLREAERVHKIYSETKHGKAEFQQVKSGNNVGHNEENTKEASDNKGENILYGYLGTAEDLDQLDFDMKRRCVIKSKKDIQNIAEAPLKK